MDEIVKKIILFFVLSFAVSDVFAEVDPKLLGRWVSEPMYEGTEKLIVEYEFEDAENLTMKFYTRNRVEGTGCCLSRTSLYFTYRLVGPVCVIELRDKPFDVEILKFWLDDFTLGTLVESQRQCCRDTIVKQMNTLVEAYEGGSMMVYVTVDDPDKIAFIIGDEADAMHLDLNRFTGDVASAFFSDADRPSRISRLGDKPSYSPSSYSRSSSSSIWNSGWFKYGVAFVICMIYSMIKNWNKGDDSSSRDHETSDVSSSDASGSTITPPEYHPHTDTPPEYNVSDVTPPDCNSDAPSDGSPDFNSADRDGSAAK